MISQGPVISVSSCFCYFSLRVGQPSLVNLFCFSLHPPSNWELILLGCTQFCALPALPSPQHGAITQINAGVLLSVLHLRHLLALLMCLLILIFKCTDCRIHYLSVQSKGFWGKRCTSAGERGMVPWEKPDEFSTKQRLTGKLRCVSDFVIFG